MVPLESLEGCIRIHCEEKKENSDIRDHFGKKRDFRVKKSSIKNIDFKETCIKSLKSDPLSALRSSKMCRTII